MPRTSISEAHSVAPYLISPVTRCHYMAAGYRHARPRIERCYHPQVNQGRHNNNFDLLRILAALQVAIIHSAVHLKLGFGPFLNALSMFPGVPVFFVISGFLVSESLERSTLQTYFVKRALRIFPGMWMCLVVSIVIAAAFGVSFAHPTVVPWVLGQLTIVQFYNPDFLRSFGVGVLNGSLWTIPVELQFYLVLPVIYWLTRSNLLLVALTAAAIVVSQLFVFAGVAVAETTAMKLAGVTLAPYLYAFLFGVLLQRNREFVRRYLTGWLPLWILLYVGTELLMQHFGAIVSGNYLNPVSTAVLACLVLSAAHAKPIPVKHDLSYGLYLYHMPVINAFLAAGAVGSVLASLSAITIAVVLAYLSWTFVELPALRLKHRVRLGSHQARAAIER